MNNQERIAATIQTLTPEIKKMHSVALAEGFKDEVCPLSETVFLAHHHFTRCQRPECPMVSRDQKGNRNPTMLEQRLFEASNVI